MAYTHDFILKFDNDHEYSGEIELSPSGVLSYKSESDLELMAGQLEDELKSIFEKIGNLYSAYGGLIKFKITKKGEQ